MNFAGTSLLSALGQLLILSHHCSSRAADVPQSVLASRSRSVHGFLNVFNGCTRQSIYTIDQLCRAINGWDAS